MITEPGAGLIQLAHNTLDDYDNFDGWEVQEGSTAGMITSSEQSLKNEEPIIVTVWKPNLNAIILRSWKMTILQLIPSQNYLNGDPYDMQGVFLDAQDFRFGPVDVVEFCLVSTPWGTELSSSHVLQIILKQIGYEVSITNVDTGVMFQAIAIGEGDDQFSTLVTND